MINIHNISNLEMFNQEGYSVSCPKDLQEAIQAGIVKKVRKLFNTEGFLALIPNFDPTEDTKLRIHLTKDGITIQLLEKDTSNPKVDTPYTKNDLELSEEVKTRKEKIIKKIDSLLKKPSALDSSARLESKVHPLFIPSQPNKEQAPSKIYFDATLSNPQIQQLHARIEDLQNQLNKKNPYPEELKVIKEQLVFLNQAILNLSLKQENITYPHTEEYTLINKLVDNQQDIYRALLDLLSRNLNQTSNTIPQNLSVIQDTGIKEMAFKSKENTSLEELVDLKEGLKELSNLQKEKDDLEIANATLQENLLSKEAQIATLEQKIQNLPTDEALYQLQSQLETLQNEKANLQSQQDGFISQLEKLTKASKVLESSNATLQENLLSKEAQIATLEQKIQNLPTDETIYQLQSQLETLQNEKANLQSQQDGFISQLEKLTKASKVLESSNATLQENLLSKEAQIATLEQKIQNLPTDEALYQLQSQLETLQNEKANLQSQQDGFISQLEKLTKSSKGLKSSNATLQENLLSKEAQIATLEQKIQNLPTDETIYQLQSQLEMLQNDRANLQVKLSDKNEKIFELNKEIQSLSEVHQALQNQLRDEKEIVSILETAAIPTISSKVELIETIIEEEKNKMEQNLSLLENNAIPENLLIPTSDYYTLTPKVLQEESFETATEITTLQAEIKYLREELEDIRPIVYNTTRKIEKTEKSNKDLTLELSKKTKAIEDLEEEKKFLESRLNKSESQLKDLQKAQYIFKEQQKEISLSSEENNDLLEELEKIQEKLSLEKRARAELEKTHQDQLEKLKDLYNENVLEKMEHINTKIANLQQQKKNTCFTLAQVLTDYIRAGSITEDVGQSIVGLMEEAFNNNTTEYKALLDLVSSEEEDFVSSEESASSDEYNEDSYLGS